MDRLESNYSKNTKKKVLHLLKIVNILIREQRSSIKLNQVERIRRSISHKLYPFSNEYLTQYMTNLNLINKNVMVVGSSGDQALCAAYLGAKEVCLIDANPLTKPFFELKLAALKCLSYDDFLDFLDVRRPSALNLETFDKIKSLIPLESRLFWEILLSNYTLKKIRNCLFQHLRVFDEKDILYLQNLESFNLIKQKIPNVKFQVYTANISKFHTFAKQRNYYSLIMLSNICDYITRAEYKDAVRNLIPFLSSDGVMQVAYEFDKTDADYSYLNGFNYFRVEQEAFEYSVVFLKKDKQKHRVDALGNKIYRSPYLVGIENLPNTSQKEY